MIYWTYFEVLIILCSKKQKQNKKTLFFPSDVRCTIKNKTPLQYLWSLMKMEIAAIKHWDQKCALPGTVNLWETYSTSLRASKYYWSFYLDIAQGSFLRYFYLQTIPICLIRGNIIQLLDTKHLSFRHSPTSSKLYDLVQEKDSLNPAAGSYLRQTT